LPDFKKGKKKLQKRNRKMPASSLFRSEEMTYFKLYIPTEIAQATVASLAELKLLEFRDVKSLGLNQSS
jgi:hypothetical protein